MNQQHTGQISRPPTARFALKGAIAAPREGFVASARRFLLERWAGRVLLIALGLAIVEATSGYDAPVPWRITLAVYCIWGLVKLAPRLWRAAFFRVRSKLMIAYLLTAVLPLFFGVALVLLAGQLMLSVFAARLVSSEIDRHQAVLAAETRSMLRRFRAGEPGRRMSASLEGVGRVHRNAAFAVVQGGTVVAREGNAPTELPAWLEQDEFVGLFRDGDRQVLRAVERRENVFVVMEVPFDVSLFDRLRSENGILVRRVDRVAPGSRSRPRVSLGRGSGVRVESSGSPTPDPSATSSPAPSTEAPGSPAPSQAGSASPSTSPSPSASPSSEAAPWNSFVATPTQLSWDAGARSSITVLFSFDITTLFRSLTPGRERLSEVLLIALGVVAAIFAAVYLVALFFGMGLARSITSAVHALSVGTRKLSDGDFSHRIRVRSRDQLGELAGSFNSMAQGIEDLLDEQREKERLEEDLRVARDLQMSLLPRQDVTLPGLRISAVCLPATEMGGDYYDLLPLGKAGDRLGVLIADVSGKGPSAALYMAELKGLVLSLSRIHESPRALLKELNEILAPNLDSKSFVTMTYAIIDSTRRKIVFSRAGHNPLIHFDGRTKEARLLTPAGLALGLDRGETFARVLQEQELPLVSGDVFVFFTDGISEAMNARADLFGESRLTRIVSQASELTSEQLKEKILEEVRSFAAGESPHDDMTMVVVRVA